MSEIEICEFVSLFFPLRPYLEVHMDVILPRVRFVTPTGYRLLVFIAISHAENSFGSFPIRRPLLISRYSSEWLGSCLRLLLPLHVPCSSIASINQAADISEGFGSSP
jgi:hypothetical protein